VDESRGEDQCRARERRRRDPQNRPQEVRVAPCCERVQREVHDVHDQERDSEDDTVTAERVGDGERGDEHRRHSNQHRPPDRAHTGIDGVGQPGIGRPRPPKRGEDQQTMGEPAPGRVVPQHRRDLRETEHEDQIEEQLERRNRVPALDALLAHNQTLARPDQSREFADPRPTMRIHEQQRTSSQGYISPSRSRRRGRGTRERAAGSCRGPTGLDLLPNDFAAGPAPRQDRPDRYRDIDPAATGAPDPRGPYRGHLRFSPNGWTTTASRTLSRWCGGRTCEGLRRFRPLGSMEAPSFEPFSCTAGGDGSGAARLGTGLASVRERVRSTVVFERKEW
jgi:hypothetical protein